MKRMSDPNLVSSEFNARLREHGALVRRICWTYAWTPEDRQDLGQEIALQLWRSYPRYDTSRPFSTWLYRVGLNVALSWRRSDARRVTGEPLEDHPEPSTSEDWVSGLYVETLLAKQPPLDRALLLLYLEELSYLEIAEILGTTETNVAARLSRLRKRLRETESQENHGT